MQEGEQIEGLEVDLDCRFEASLESDVWHSGLRAAGPIRPSLPWCFSSAAPPLDPSCARRQQARWQPAVQKNNEASF